MTARRGVPSAVGATRAWISTSIGRVPSMPANTQEPLTLPRRSARNKADGLCHAGKPGIGHFENADFVGGAEPVLDGAQNAEMMAPLALEIEHGVDHMFENPGTGDLPILCHMADQEKGETAAFGQPDQFAGASPHLGDRAGGRIQAVQIHGLDGIDDNHGRRLAVVQAGDDIAQRRGRGQMHRRCQQA